MQTYLAAEHRRRRLREPRGALESAVAHKLLHRGDVDVPLLRAGVHPGRVDVHAHHVLGDAAVAFFVSTNTQSGPTKRRTNNKQSIDRHRTGTKNTTLFSQGSIVIRASEMAGNAPTLPLRVVWCGIVDGQAAVVPDIPDDEDEVEPGEDGGHQVDVLRRALEVVVAPVDGVGGG